MKLKNIDLSKTSWVFAIATFCCFLWGSAFPVTQICYKLCLTDATFASQWLLAGVRFMIAGLMVMVGLCVYHKELYLPDGAAMKNILRLSLFQTTAQYGFLYIGLAHMSSAQASIMVASAVFMQILLSAYVFHQETLNSKKILGCVVGFMGVVLVNMGGSSSGTTSALGVVMVLLSCLSYSTATCLMKEWGSKADPIMIAGWQFFVGGVTLTIMGLAFGGSVSPSGFSGWSVCIYLALVSAVGYSLWSVLLRYNPVSKVSVYFFENPVFGVILSAAFFGNEMGISAGIATSALALVCAGIYIVNK